MVLWFDIYAKIKLYITIDIYKFSELVSIIS